MEVIPMLSASMPQDLFEDRMLLILWQKRKLAFVIRSKGPIHDFGPGLTSLICLLTNNILFHFIASCVIREDPIQCDKFRFEIFVVLKKHGSDTILLVSWNPICSQAIYSIAPTLPNINERYPIILLKLS